MTTLKLETQQSDGGGGGGDVTREYVDQRDAATLDSANGYTDLVASGKQNTLTAGTNITIEDNVISADGITGVSWGDIDGNLADQTDLSSALGDKQDTLTAGANISIDANNEISATDTTYSAGANISIDANNEISATDTTYTAGSGLDLTGTEFSVDSTTVALKSDLPTNTSDLTNDGATGDSVYVEANELATVATTGEYSDLLNAPDVNDATLTITQNGVSAGTFTANASSDVTIAVTDTTYSNFVGTDGVSAGVAGLVPGPATTDAGTYLKADGTWATPPGTTYSAGTNIQINGTTISATDTTYTHFTGTDGQADGTQGLVPGPLTTDVDKFLSADGTWQTPPGTTYTAGTNVNISAQNVISAIDTTYTDFVGTDGITDGDNGLVPAPITSDVDKYLKSDGTWATVQAGATITMQTTDPGEGQPLAANNFIAVYSAS